jgi:hypothetical protein
MEQDSLQLLWHGMVAPQQSTETLKNMTGDKAHPVLKRIRRQMIIESIAFIVFMVVYYDFFDGNRKPRIANLVLVTGLALVIMHNVIGFVLAKELTIRHSIKQTLEAQLAKIKSFALISIFTRILAAACFLYFFTSVSDTTWVLAAIIIIFILQFVLLWTIWRNRIRQLRQAIDSLKH